MRYMILSTMTLPYFDEGKYKVLHFKIFVVDDDTKPSVRMGRKT